MIALRVNHVAKYYSLATVEKKRYGRTLKEELLQFVKNPRLLFENQDRRKKIRALSGITFTLQKGEVMGVIGANGAGKTTLLKIIAGITPPTRGEIRLYGKIVALLRIDAGFHPELTGRENIFLAGTLLGLSKKEISKDLAHIIAFSGVKKFVDMPLKYYSSGMRLRLAFSVATSTYTKPDILLIDEVFAVGDARFYAKSLTRIGNLIKEHGVSVIIAGHNVKEIATLSTKCIWLDKGKIKHIGKTNTVIEKYRKYMSSPKSSQR